MRWSFRSREASRSGWQRSFIAHSNQFPVLASESRNSRKVSQDPLWSGQGDQTWTRCSFGYSSKLNSSSPYAMDHCSCCLHHQSIPHSSGWKDLIRAGVQQGSFRSFGSFRGKSSGSSSSPPPPIPKPSFESSGSEALLTGWENVSSLECTSM